MKKLLCAVLIMCFALLGCGTNLAINGRTYKTIGMVNMAVNDNRVLEAQAPEMQYRPIWTNIIIGAIFLETVVAPVYFFGFSMFEPVGLRIPKE